MMKYLITLILALCSFGYAQAFSSETFEFADEVQKTRYQALAKELRCPKCQNQNLADSNAPISKDLKLEVYNLLQEGKSDKEIVDFMVERYGEFVLYRPKVSKVTYVLWYGPAVLIIIGIICVIVIVRKKPAKKVSAELTDEQKAQLESILKEK